MKYKAKVMEFEAIQWTGDNFAEVKAFTNGECSLINKCLFIDGNPVNTGSYIYMNGFGEYRAMLSCRFEEQFEPAEA